MDRSSPLFKGNRWIWIPVLTSTALSIAADLLLALLEWQ